MQIGQHLVAFHASIGDAAKVFAEPIGRQPGMRETRLDAAFASVDCGGGVCQKLLVDPHAVPERFAAGYHADAVNGAVSIFAALALNGTSTTG